MTLTEFSHKEVASDERLGEGIRAGVFIANSLRELGFLELVKRCQDDGVFQVAPSTASNCVSGTPAQLTAAVAAPAPGLIPLKVRVNSAGESDPDGRYCVEVKSCSLMAQGHLIAVNITTAWVGVNNIMRVTNHQIRVLR